jgi:lambda family phage tail tape measure protein
MNAYVGNYDKLFEAYELEQEQIQAQKESLEISKLRNQQAQEQLTLAGEIKVAEMLATEETKKNAAYAKTYKGPVDRLNLETKAQEALDELKADSAAKEGSNEAARAAQRVDQLRKRLTGEADVAKQKADYASKELDLTAQIASAQGDNRLQEINNLVSIGKLTQDQATLEIAQINRGKILFEQEKQRRDLKTQETNIKTKTVQDIKVVGELAKPELSGLGELGINTDQVNTPSLIAYRSALTQLSESEKVQLGLLTQEAILQDTVTRGKLEAVNATFELTERQKAYSDIFTSGIDRMTDSIMEFAKTGKLNFKDLINSLIADIIRFEIKAKLMALYLQAKPFLMSMFAPSFGGADLGGVGSGANPYAKGGAFDSGVQAFAQGGAFTNKIVDSPTLFKFARGTGMMGEAGPEAIMPLKRDGQGNLGVRGNQGSSGNVEVTVNNYGSEKAETKETTDSRGNRKIEVIIGEASASDMNRSGSASQKAIGGTFGLRPQLIRR